LAFPPPQARRKGRKEGGGGDLLRFAEKERGEGKKYLEIVLKIREVCCPSGTNRPAEGIRAAEERGGNHDLG